MLAHRIIPTILSKNGLLVKGEGFKADRIVGNALQAARIHAMRGVDELVILDVTATKEGREPDYEMVSRLADGCFAPLTVGGGINKIKHIRELLKAGADKVCIGAAAMELKMAIGDPVYDYGTLIQCAAIKFGNQAIVKSVDYDHLAYPVRATGGDIVVDAALKAESCGAGELLLQNIYGDGTMDGYDLDMIKRVSEAVSIPVIASGGCSGYEDMYQAIQAGASAVAVGALFQFTDCTPKGAAEYLSSKGVEVRL